MSYISYRDLRAVNDPTLKSFHITIDLDGETEARMDTLSRHDGYWRNIHVDYVQRNMSMEYRTDPANYWSTILPATRHDIPGWGSFIQFRITPNNQFGYKMYGRADIEIVPRSIARDV